MELVAGEDPWVKEPGNHCAGSHTAYSAFLELPSNPRCFSLSGELAVGLSPAQPGLGLVGGKVALSCTQWPMVAAEAG